MKTYSKKRPKLVALAIACFLFCFPFTSQAQQSVQDSLILLISAHPEEDERKAELLNALAFNISNTDPKKGLAYAQQVIDFADNLKEKRHLSLAYMIKGINLMHLGEYEAALEFQKLAIEGLGGEEEKSNLASAISNIGVIYKYLNVYPKALSNLQEAARLFKEIGHPNELIMYQNMAVIYSEQENFDKALEYYEIARDGAVGSNNKQLEALAVFNLGTLLINQDKLDEGLRYLDTALIISKKINDNMTTARIYGNMGEAYNKLGDNAKSIALLNRALNLNDSIGNRKSRALNLLNLGDTYYNMGNLPLAGRYGRQAYQEGKSLKTIDVQRDAAQNLSNYFESIGNADSALFYYKQHILLRDSIDNEQNTKQLTRLEMQYDFDLKEQEYLKEQELSRLRIRQFWLYGIIVLIVLMGVGAYLLNRSRIRTLRLRNEAKEKELLQKAEALLLQQQLAESELKAIRSQMSPHFIFNVLNTIESYILDNDPGNASRLVQKFAGLTRLVLENSTKGMVPVAREWKVVQLYIELEAIRFGNQFGYSLEMNSKYLLEHILLPPMLIQPLVENAILHGLRHVKGYKGELRVSLVADEDKLIITVMDNGVGLGHAPSSETSVNNKEKSMGITGIRERVAIMNAKDEKAVASFELINLNELGENGTKAILVLPLLVVDKEVVA